MTSFNWKLQTRNSILLKEELKTLVKKRMGEKSHQVMHFTTSACGKDITEVAMSPQEKHETFVAFMIGKMVQRKALHATISQPQMLCVVPFLKYISDQLLIARTIIFASQCRGICPRLNLTCSGLFLSVRSPQKTPELAY